MKTITFINLILSPLFISLLAKNSRAQTPVSAGLIAHYCFDGNADDAVGTKHCTVYGATLTTDRLGRANRAYFFDGVDDYIQIPSAVWFSGGFTISGWLKVDSYKGFGRFYEFGRGAPGDNVVYSPTPTGWSATNDAFVIRRNSCTSPVEESANAGAFPYSVWVHVVTVFKGLTGTVWRNGVNVTIATTGFTAPPCSVLRTGCYFGKSAWSHDAYFHGKMDDVRIYNRALSAAEIDTLYKLDNTCIPCDDLIAGFVDSMTTCLSYQFKDTSKLATKGIANWNWSFGDGGSSSLKNPYHTYSSSGSYTVRLIVTDSLGCIDTATHILNLASTKFANAGFDESLCLNDTGLAITTLFGSGGISYSWSPSTGLDNPLTASTMARISTNSSYILTVEDSRGCVDKDTVNLSISKTATIIANPKIVNACKGSTVQLFANGGVSYTWAPSTNLNNASIANPVLNAIDSGIIVVTGLDKNGCKGYDTISVSLFKNPRITISPRDTSLCIGNKLQLQALGAKRYKWLPAENMNNDTINNPILTVYLSTKISVTGIDSNGCFSTNSININTHPNSQVKASSSNNHINCLNNSTTLNASNAEKYFWTPAIYCESPQQSSTQVYPINNTIFTITGIDKNGCESSDTITVFFDGNSSIQIPNAFTPNNDFINDRIRIIDKCNFALANISIYNRWGEEVFHSSDINQHWDGTSNGKPCQSGVYYYFVKGFSQDGKELIFKGDISLLR